jgi:hypothetical protein
MVKLQHREIEPDGVRPPLAEGIMYPADPGELEASLERLLTEAEQALQSGGVEEPGSGWLEEPGSAPPVGALVPHAAYDLVGRAIAAGLLPLRSRLRAASGRLRRIVLLAPVHREHFTGIALPDLNALRSPLGETRVDTEAVNLIAERVDGAGRDNLPFLEEHAPELTLPFLRHISPETPVLPILTGDNSSRTEATLYRALALLTEQDPGLTDHYVLVSGNLSAYLDPVRAEADMRHFLQLAGAGKSGELAGAFGRAEVSACASATTAAVLRLCGGSATPLLPPFAEEDETGGRVVYYATLLLTAAGKP